MKLLFLPLFFLMTCFACNQSGASGKRQPANNGLSYDTAAIYRSMTHELCDCLSREIQKNKASVAMDTCYKIVIEKYADQLRGIGVDLSVSTIENGLFDHVDVGRCKNMLHLLDEERIAEDAKLLLVKGEFISQRKLASGEYEVTLHEDKTGKQKVLKSKNRFPEEMVKDQSPGYELTVEYKVVKNKKTGKDELYIKEESEGGLLRVMGAVIINVKK